MEASRSSGSSASGNEREGTLADAAAEAAEEVDAEEADAEEDPAEMREFSWAFAIRDSIVQKPACPDRTPAVQVDQAQWHQRFANFKASGNKEIILRENFGREGADLIQQLASDVGLYSKSYGKGRGTVLAVSSVPLPNYRADLDSKLQVSVR
ncbi:hypothetical protein T484DRAFT_1772705 [Baffinella frigidus]|nr:hypothetical protein T484DRAFT_1772705 [Cryptophyta sp. CCMP2293]